MIRAFAERIARRRPARDVSQIDTKIGGLQEHRVNLEFREILRQRIAYRRFPETLLGFGWHGGKGCGENKRGDRQYRNAAHG